MNENEMLQEDEISLFDLWEKLREGWLVVVGGTVLGIAGALLAIFLIPPKYEAVAIIQIGLIGSPGKEIQGANSVAVEPPSQAVERMKTPVFQIKAANAADDQEWLENISRVGMGGTDDLRLQVIKGTVAQGQTPLVELRATGRTPEVAKKKAEVSIACLASVHADMAAPSLAKMNAELKLLKEKLVISESESVKLSKMASTTGGLEERLSPMVLLNNVRGLKDAELRQNILALEMALSIPATQPTKAIEETYVSARPVAPKKSLLLALGTIGGLLAGILRVFVADAWRRAKTAREGR
jgi:hypothetical protein